MEWQKHIEMDPEVLVGKPVVKGTRISVEFVTELLAAGWRDVQDIRACPACAGKLLQEESVNPLTAA